MSHQQDDTTGLNRRHLLLGIAGAGLAASQATAQAPQSPLSGDIPIYVPRTEFVYEAIVDIAPGMDLGEGPLGQRAMVPITGGTFEGPDIRGTVLPGGADRQLVRADGYRLLDALYELETDDGAIITVRNNVVITPDRGRRPFSSLQITAPRGKYEWLNHSIHVGTLDGLPPERRAVLIRVFRVI